MDGIERPHVASAERKRDGPVLEVFERDAGTEHPVAQGAVQIELDAPCVPTAIGAEVCVDQLLGYNNVEYCGATKV